MNERAIERLRREAREHDSAERKAKRIREAALEHAEKRIWYDKRKGDEKLAGPPPKVD